MVGVSASGWNHWITRYTQLALPVIKATDFWVRNFWAFQCDHKFGGTYINLSKGRGYTQGLGLIETHGVPMGPYYLPYGILP